MPVEKDSRKIALIVASGPSAAPMRTFRVNKREIAVIGVNGVLDWMPFLDYFFTLDPTKVNRKRMRTYRHNARYFIAYPKGKVLLPSYVTRFDRYSPAVNPFHPDKDPCAIGLNIAPNVINSGNSAFGALGLAYHLGFEKVGLIGVDANNAPRLDGGYSRDLSHLPDLFESAMGQIDIVNLGDMYSKVPTMSLDEFVKGVPHLSSKRIVESGYNAAMGEQRGRLLAYELAKEKGLANPTIGQMLDPVTQLPLFTSLTDHATNESTVDGDLVLHQDVDVRTEGPGTHLHLPYLTTVL